MQGSRCAAESWRAVAQGGLAADRLVKLLSSKDEDDGGYLRVEFHLHQVACQMVSCNSVSLDPEGPLPSCTPPHQSLKSGDCWGWGKTG